jgi:hypothetical protein
MDAVFFRVDMEAVLGDAKVLSLETRVTVRKSHNF